MKSFKKKSKNFIKELARIKYAYNFSWLGFKVLQVPQDLQAMQEIIWEVKPDLIIETGVAFGGSLMFCASMLALLEVCGEIKDGRVIGVEINLFPENSFKILSHPLSKYINIISGSSVNKDIVKSIKYISNMKKRILVCLDSNHTHEHVLAELRAYAPLVSVGSYIIVNDTGVEDLPDKMSFNRPWGKGNNPRTAVIEFLEENDDFIIDESIDERLIISGNLGGYLRRIK